MFTMVKMICARANRKKPSTIAEQVVPNLFGSANPEDSGLSFGFAELAGVYPAKRGLGSGAYSLKV